MEITQIAFSSDGRFLYALDAKGNLWASLVSAPGQQSSGVPNLNPVWMKIKGPESA